MTAFDEELPTARRVCLVCQKEYPPEERRCPSDGTVLVALAADLYVGKVIADRYEVQEMLGQGGTSMVYRAYHRQLKRFVAIKMLKAHLVIDEESKRRFEQEARAVSCLAHANIVTIYDVGVTKHSEPYIVMEYIEGVPLSEVIAEKKRLDTEEAIEIFSQCCAALAHAHDNKVVHRDVKPSNIMLLQNEEGSVVKIVDFGLAKLHSLTGEFQGLTKTGEVFGSPVYMSPEQCTGKKLDARTDIYSMGVVMYETLVGRPPFKQKTSIEIIRHQIKEMPPRPSEVAPEVKIPGQMEAIILKCLAKSPDERFSSMAELKTALDTIAPKRRSFQRAKSYQLGQLAEPPAVPAGNTTKRKALGLVLLLVLCCIAVAAAAGLIYH